MKVIVLANDEQRNELLVQPVREDLQIEWLTGPGGSTTTADACIDLLFDNEPARVEWLMQAGISIIVINSVVHTLRQLPQHFIRINGWNTFLGRPLVEASCRDESIKGRAEILFENFNRKTEWVPDVPGLITPRIVASIINEAFLALEEKVSRENEIDTAMKLGTNYPYGPFEWGQKIGLDKVYSLLEVLGNDQSRYKPSTLLREKILV
jgi:3-hydroxybutyryl-CoA dehydrogenase